MLCSLVEKPARFAPLFGGCAAAWLLCAIGRPAAAQTTSSGTVSTSNVSVSTVSVPPIQVPKISVQVTGARPSASPTGASTVRSWAVSAPAEGEEGEEETDPDNPQPDLLRPIVPQRVGARNPSSTRPTGILQLVSAAEPVDPTQGTTFPAPPPDRLPTAAPQASLQWTNPYETGMAEQGAKGLYRFLPSGFIPWGPRTPLADRAADSPRHGRLIVEGTYSANGDGTRVP